MGSARILVKKRDLVSVSRVSYFCQFLPATVVVDQAIAAEVGAMAYAHCGGKRPVDGDRSEAREEWACLLVGNHRVAAAHMPC